MHNAEPQRQLELALEESVLVRARLDARQMALVRAYLANEAQTDAEARKTYAELAREVGYGGARATDNSLKQAVHKALNSDKVQAALAEIRLNAARRAEVTEGEVLRGLRKVAAQSAGDERVTKTLTALRSRTVTDSEGKEHEEYEAVAVDVDVYDPSPASALRAWELMGKKLGMWVDRAELTGRDGAPLHLSDAELDARIRELSVHLDAETDAE